MKLDNNFKLIKLLSATEPENPKSFVCLLTDLSVPGTIAAMISLFLDLWEGAL